MGPEVEVTRGLIRAKHNSKRVKMLPAQPNQSLIDGLECLQALSSTDRPVGSRELARMLGLEGYPRQQIEGLARNFSLRVVALTRGAEGSLLFQGDRWSELPTSQVEVRDTVGAGDAFTAALCLGLLCGMDLDTIHEQASRVAAYVCGCIGATPSLPAPLRQQFVNLRIVRQTSAGRSAAAVGECTDQKE